MKYLLTVLLIASALSSSKASTVDTLEIFSKAMNRNVKTVLITPSTYAGSDKKFPVVYLLHGAFGNYANWVTRVPHIKELAERLQVMIVCPDGGYTSWYYDSPIDPSYQFETFVAVEVPQYIDMHYRTIATRKGRAITGLSMGGHGGFFLGYRHADTFGAIGSMSGALNSTVIKRGYDVEKRLGDTLANKKYWEEWSALAVADHYPKDSVAITFDCGTEDGLIGANRAMHDKLLRAKVPHDYTERPGKHDWAYWANAIDYQLVFFKKYFDKGAR